MPPLPMPLDPPDKVFGLAAPHHMLMKLKWEIFQLRTVAAEPCKPGAEIEPGYHAFNCAVTAWHMADWVWQSASPQDRAELLSKLNIVATGKSRKDFGAFTKALMDRHRVLHICRQIATGSKHKEVEVSPDPEVVAEERWDIEPARVRSRISVQITTYSIRLMIRDGDVSRSALELFEEAARTWDQLLREWGYLEARYVDDRC
jgi:hypothetical protein